MKMNFRAAQHEQRALNLSKKQQTHILPVCTGNEQSYIDHGQIHRAHTPRGHFKVTRKIRGYRLSSLGLLYYPNYIYEGIAIHGSWAMAVNPDSHVVFASPCSSRRSLASLCKSELKSLSIRPSTVQLRCQSPSKLFKNIPAA